jgi:flavoprotein
VKRETEDGYKRTNREMSQEPHLSVWYALCDGPCKRQPKNWKGSRGVYCKGCGTCRKQCGRLKKPVVRD